MKEEIFFGVRRYLVKSTYREPLIPTSLSSSNSYKFTKFPNLIYSESNSSKSETENRDINDSANGLNIHNGITYLFTLFK